jgi:ketol-acid reductoisomerase
MYRGGINYMRYSVSDTAEHGDYVAGPRIVTDETRKAMQKLLDEIKDGRSRRTGFSENQTGRRTFNKTRAPSRITRSSVVGAQLRGMMPFLDPVHIKPGSNGV